MSVAPYQIGALIGWSSVTVLLTVRTLAASARIKIQKRGVHGQRNSGVLNFTAMNVTRAHIPLCARLLLLLVFFNGLACSIGHGQMLHGMFESSTHAAFSTHAAIEHQHGHAMEGTSARRHGSTGMTRMLI